MDQLKSYLEKCNLKEGKMFGILLVENKLGITGQIWGYSGNIINGIDLTLFAEPIYDITTPGSYFKEKEKYISNLNSQIKKIEKESNYLTIKHKIEEHTIKSSILLTTLKKELKIKKEDREQQRKKDLSKDELERLINESKFQKAEFKRTEKRIKQEKLELTTLLNKYTQELQSLKIERKQESAKLQDWIFKQFNILNGNGQVKNLIDIFAATPLKTPPAGAGECAAPRLIQYAYKNNLKPISLIEFWWGESPKSEIRIHGNIYPPCKGKCGPILAHMLIGLSNKETLIAAGNDIPLELAPTINTKINILYQDNFMIAVEKPAGMLTVPGKTPIISLLDILKHKYSDIYSVHRLDMSTSGIVLFAKDKQTHKKLQELFIKRIIKKSYIAILDGSLKSKMGDNYKSCGEISIPISADYINRPRQKADYTNGKTAITRFEIIKHINNKTVVRLYPITGRTHQLRIHCAHPDGLGIPILGDNLYGNASDRLYLHAENLTLPWVNINCSLDFDKI